MALLQVFPKFDVRWSKFDGGVPVPVVPPGVQREFRTGADLTDLFDTIMSTRNVAVNAAPGAGKSTVLPMQLAKRAGLPVLHVLPFPQLAASLHAYVVKKCVGEKIVLVDSVEQSYPDSGLCITSAGQMVARWMHLGEAALPQCIVLHDESHESGAASGVMRTLLKSLPGVRSYVTMTATAGVAPARPMETGGSVEDRVYDGAEFEDPWQVEESGAPWSVYTLPGHILIFEDDKTRASELLQAYNYNGVDAFRLHSGSPAKQVVDVIARLNNDITPAVCAVIADSSYRSGYTFPVSLVVDSGRVKRVVEVGGKPVAVSRGIYESERVQARARGGRTPGLRTQYWRPVGDVENCECVLEQPDVEALALILRVLGYRVPAMYSAAKMATGPVPKFPETALRGHMPLSCLTPGELAEPDVLASGGLAPSIRAASPSSDLSMVGRGRSAVRYAAGSNDTEPQVLLQAGRKVEGHVRSDSGYDGGSVRAGLDETPEEVLADLMAGLAGTPRVALGQYCVVDGAVTSHVTSTSFPRGAESVVRVFGDGAASHLKSALSDFDLSVAVNATANAYNLSVMQWRAWARVLQHVRSEGAGRDIVAMRAWVERCAEEVTRLGASAEAGLGILLDLAEHRLHVRAVDELLEAEETRFVAALTASFGRVPARSIDRGGDERRRVKGWVDASAGALGYSPGAVATRPPSLSSGSVSSSSSSVHVDLPRWAARAVGYTGHARPMVQRVADASDVDRGKPDKLMFVRRK